MSPNRELSMRTLRAFAFLAAVMLAAAAALAEPTQRTPSSAPASPESTEAGRDQSTAPSSGSLKRDAKQAWSEASNDARKTGRTIGDDARSFGRATRDAAVNAWKKVKAAFSG
jgi:hypothetical protein